MVQPKRQTAKLIDFKWHTPEAGLSWKLPRTVCEGRGEWQSSNQRFLVWDFLGACQLYRPLDEPTLFRVFASTTPTEEGILGFASKYGPLGARPHRVLLDEPDKTEYQGELLETWEANIWWMNRAVQIWDAINGRPRKRKLLLSLLNERDFERAANLHIYDLKPSGPSERESVTRDPLAHARFILSHLVDRSIHEVPLAFGPDLHVSIGPQSLRDALWLQLATSIEGKKAYGRCEWCNQWFLIPPKASDRKRFCKDSCRVMASQHRRRVAMQRGRGRPTCRKTARKSH